MRSVIISEKYNNFDCHYLGKYIFFYFTVCSAPKVEARPCSDILWIELVSNLYPALRNFLSLLLQQVISGCSPKDTQLKVESVVPS